MTAPAVAPRLKGKTFALVGTLTLGARGKVEQLIRSEGGDVASSVTHDIDCLVVGATRGRGKPAAQKQAEKHNANGAAIAVIDEAQFVDMLVPSADETIALLRSGVDGVTRWNRICGERARDIKVDLTGADLANTDLTAAHLTCVKLTDVDLRGATLSDARLGDITDVRFDGATLDNAHIHIAIGCRFRNARVERMWCNRAVRCEFDGARGDGCYIDELSHCTARGAEFNAGHVSKLDDVDLTDAQLRQVHSYYLHAPKCVMPGAALSDAVLVNAAMPGSNLDHADLTRAQLAGVDLTDANLRGATCVSARLEGANLTHALLADANLNAADLANAKLVKADLSHADLRNANLASADLSDAIVDGADFTGANVTGAILDGVDVARATGLDPARSVGGGIGPNVLELERVSQKAGRLELSAAIDTPDHKRVRLTIHTSASRHGSTCHGYQHDDDGTRYGGNWVQANNLSGCMASMGAKWGHGELHIDTVKASSSKSPVKGKTLRDLTIAAWCEAFGVDIPTAGELRQAQAGARAELDTLRAERIALLRTGADGVAAWNGLTPVERKRPKNYRNADLADADLRGVELTEMDFAAGRFDNADLTKSTLTGADLKNASLRGATLTKAESGWGLTLNDADLDGADLTRVRFTGVSLLRTTLRGATLASAAFSNCDLRGADLSTALQLADATFEHCRYDEQTLLPEGFMPPDGWVWAGAGPDPRIREKVQAKVEARQAAGPIDIDAFMKELEQRTDASRLDKALRMLKKSGFQLYADTTDAQLVGVVKSQTDDELVYACRLTDDGQFSCCTQNLNVCGGLRGALCKHLLVLIIGLTKAGELDPAVIDEWVEMSHHNAPQLDKDAMGDVFLRYKGAEAGEVDWRPTETLPEDYYAF